MNKLQEEIIELIKYDAMMEGSGGDTDFSKTADSIIQVFEQRVRELDTPHDCKFTNDRGVCECYQKALDDLLEAVRGTKP